jgi:hypothetical protein
MVYGVVYTDCCTGELPLLHSVRALLAAYRQNIHGVSNAIALVLAFHIEPVLDHLLHL